MKCKNCGKEFDAKTIVQKYCSTRCRSAYNRTHNMDEQYPSITFTCPKCGKLVVTEGGSRDRRTRFCSASCEKKFWRHPPWEHGTERTNFHGTKEYSSWERRTNAE